MIAHRIQLGLHHARAEDVKQVAGAFRAGKLVIYPTDTIYGLGCDGLNAGAVKRLNQVKNRDTGKPLLLLIPDIGWIERLTLAVPDCFGVLAARYWPGPLTLVFEASRLVPDALCGPKRTIGLRWAKSAVVEPILEHLGSPIVSTSANLAGEPPLMDPVHTETPLLGRVDVIVDAGPLSGKPSTVVDLTDNPPRLIREGAVSWQSLRSVLSSMSPRPLSTGEAK